MLGGVPLLTALLQSKVYEECSMSLDMSLRIFELRGDLPDIAGAAAGGGLRVWGVRGKDVRWRRLQGDVELPMARGGPGRRLDWPGSVSSPSAILRRGHRGHFGG